MFIFNVKLNSNKLFRISFILIALLVTVLLISAIYKVVFKLVIVFMNLVYIH